MRWTRSSSWTIATDQPEPLLVALYVRDALRLPTQAEPVLPSLRPQVPAHEAEPTIPSREVLADQWDAWWSQLLRDIDRYPLIAPGSTVPLGLDPETRLRRLLLQQELMPRAFGWARDRQAEHINSTTASSSDDDAIDEAVKAAQKVTRSRLDHVNLRLVELPFDEEAYWPVRTARFIISTTFRANTARFRGWLTDELVALS